MPRRWYCATQFEPARAVLRGGHLAEARPWLDAATAVVKDSRNRACRAGAGKPQIRGVLAFASESWFWQPRLCPSTVARHERRRPSDQRAVRAWHWGPHERQGASAGAVSRPAVPSDGGSD